MVIDKNLPRNERILQAAELIFSMYGYERATLDQMITLANVGKGTLYKCFGNKEQLFYKLVSMRNRPFVESLRQAVANAEALEAKLTAYFKVLIPFYCENYALWQIICFEMLNANNGVCLKREGETIVVAPFYPQIEITEEAKEKVLRYYNILRDEYKILEDIIKEGVGSGLLKDDGNIDSTTIHLFYGVIMGTLRAMRSSENNYPLTPEEAAEIVVDHFLYGSSKR